MQCEEYECEPSTSKANATQTVPVSDLNELDSALNELGMLATSINARREYREFRRECLSELNAKRPVLNLVEMNTRFVSSVSIGLRMKPVSAHIHRVKPYALPSRFNGEQRHRTKSENADILDTTGATSLVASVIDAVVSVATDEVQNMKKSKSLENVHLETEKHTVPEVELVSTCIQKLKMAE